MDTTLEAGTSFDPNVGILTPQQVTFLWPVILEVMESHPTGLLDGFFTSSDVYAAVMSNRYDLWAGTNEEDELVAVGLCRLEKYAAFSIYRICWAGGDSRIIFNSAFKKVEAYALNVLKADKLALDGRKGLTKWMGARGFKTVRFEMWKTLPRSN